MKTVEITDHYAPRTTRGGLVQPMPGPRDLARAASHAPGIGGMKQDSEIGVAMAATASASCSRADD